MAGKAYSNRGLALAVAAWVAVLAAAPWLLALPDESSGLVAVVFLPGAGDAAMLGAVAEAGGQVVRAGAFSTVLVARSDRPGFSGRLKAAGAWTVLSPGLAAGCLLIPRSAVN